MAEDWSREEVEAVVADYLAMLGCELGDKPNNQATPNRALGRVLAWCPDSNANAEGRPVGGNSQTGLSTCPSIRLAKGSCDVGPS